MTQENFDKAKELMLQINIAKGLPKDVVIEDEPYYQAVVDYIQSKREAYLESLQEQFDQL